MNFDFSDDQKQLRDAARKFLAEKCPPKAVRAVLDGKETISLPPYRIARLGIAFCPEERGIFASLDVEENLLLPPEVRPGGLTTQQVFDLFPKARNSAYLTGGGGFYRKVTSFTEPVTDVCFDGFYEYSCTENLLLGHFSSNQGGLNIGFGLTHVAGGFALQNHDYTGNSRVRVSVSKPFAVAVTV